MKTFTITFDEQRLGALSGLITAGGKAPLTGAEGMVAAAEMLSWLQAQVNAAAATSAAAITAPLP